MFRGVVSRDIGHLQGWLAWLNNWWLLDFLHSVRLYLHVHMANNLVFDATVGVSCGFYNIRNIYVLRLMVYFGIFKYYIIVIFTIYID